MNMKLAAYSCTCFEACSWVYDEEEEEKYGPCEEEEEQWKKLENKGIWFLWFFIVILICFLFNF